MPNNKTSQACQGCGGSGMVTVGASAQACPLCDGSGSAYQPGLFYMYSALITLTALQQLQTTINILNAPFKWIFATKTSTGPFTVFLADAKNQRQFMNQALHADLVFGTGQNPFPILNPWTFDQNGSIQITVTDLSNAGNTVWLGFIGVQLVSAPASSSGS